MNISHLYQESGIRFHEPQAAQLHIFHTIHGLQLAGHDVTLLALQGRQVLYTKDLGVFESDRLLDSHYGQLGLSGNAAFKLFESGVRRVQSTLRLPYFALFDSYRMADAAVRNLRGVDVIHERFNLLALGGALASRKLGVPFVLEVNADLLEQRKFKRMPEKGLRRLYAIWATRMCLATATRIISISRGLQEHLSRRWRIPESKLCVLPCAADVEAFAPNGNGMRAKQALGLADGALVIMWVGGFYPWHDLGLLLESFSKVIRRHPNAQLVLIGDGQTRVTVRQDVEKAGLQGAVIMPGAIAHSRVPEWLSVADVVVAPAAPVSASTGGTGTPLKLFEYMAAGKPIVASAVAQAAEVITDGHTGLLVKTGDVDGFAAAMQNLLDNEAERGRLGANARQRAVEQHSWAQYTRQLEAIYAEAMRDASQ